MTKKNAYIKYLCYLIKVESRRLKALDKKMGTIEDLIAAREQLLNLPKDDLNALVSKAASIYVDADKFLSSQQEQAREAKQIVSSVQAYLKQVLAAVAGGSSTNEIAPTDLKLDVIKKIAIAMCEYNKMQPSPSTQVVITMNFVNDFAVKYFGGGFGSGRLGAALAEVDLSDQPVGRSNRHLGIAMLPTIMNSIYQIFVTL